MHLFDRWRDFRDSFVMVPALFIMSGITLSFGLVTVDRALGHGSIESGIFFFTVGPDGARGILSAIASTVLSVATMAFSITISVMSTASSSFGPRLVRNFMSDRGNQVVLGTFTATFLYCLLVMRSVQSGENSVSQQSFVPHIAVNFSMFLALACVGVLIYFINHIASGIQVSTIATTVQKKFLKLIEKRFHPQEPTGTVYETYTDLVPQGKSIFTVGAEKSGYVVDIERETLGRKLKNARCTVELLVRPGDHLVEGQEIATAYSEQALTQEQQEDIREWVQEMCSVGPARTEYDDIRFVQSQIVELGVRALSPGTNDPFTLTNSTHELTVGLVRAAQASRALNGVMVEGQIKVFFPPVTAGELIDTAFDDYRSYALDHEQCVIDLLVMAGKIVALGSNDEAVARARWHAAVLVEHFRATEPLQHSLDLVMGAYERYVVEHRF